MNRYSKNYNYLVSLCGGTYVVRVVVQMSGWLTALELWQDRADLLGKVLQLAAIKVAGLSPNEHVCCLGDMLTRWLSHHHVEIRLPVHVQWHNKERQNREQRHQDVGLERRLPQQSDLINARGLFVVVEVSEFNFGILLQFTQRFPNLLVRLRRNH